MRKSVFKKHKDELKIYEMTSQEIGRLEFAMAILSDVEEMLSNYNKKITKEIEEAKEILGSEIMRLAKERERLKKIAEVM